MRLFEIVQRIYTQQKTLTPQQNMQVDNFIKWANTIEPRTAQVMARSKNNLNNLAKLMVELMMRHTNLIGDTGQNPIPPRGISIIDDPAATAGDEIVTQANARTRNSFATAGDNDTGPTIAQQANQR